MYLSGIRTLDHLQRASFRMLYPVRLRACTGRALLWGFSCCCCWVRGWECFSSARLIRPIYCGVEVRLWRSICLLLVGHHVRVLLCVRRSTATALRLGFSTLFIASIFLPSRPISNPPMCHFHGRLSICSGPSRDTLRTLLPTYLTYYLPTYTYLYISRVALACIPT